MGAWDKFKRDVSKHRGRAAVLGILFVTMVAMSVRAVLELRPRGATAAPLMPAVLEAGTDLKAEGEVNGAEAEARIKQSKVLWHALRETKEGATDPRATFTFDAAYYPAPAPIVDLSKPVGPDLAPVKPAPAPAPVIDEAGAKLSRIRDEARSLVVKTTAVGNGMTEPMAIVNQQLVTVGQKILGFEVTAIRSREVEFVKEGVTYVGKMPDGQ